MDFGFLVARVAYMHNSAEQRIAQLEWLVERARELGFYVVQDRGNVVIKRERRAAGGIVLQFGLFQTYCTNRDGGRRVVDFAPDDVLAKLAQQLSEVENDLFLNGEVSEDAHWKVIAADIDLLEAHFPPWYQLEDILKFAQSRGIPAVREGQGLTLFARGNGGYPIASLLLEGNLWFLTLPQAPRLRFDDRYLLELVHELEIILKMSSGDAMKSLEDGYHVRSVDD